MDFVRIREVFISTGVHLVCQTHAHSTESEEVMGLLVGWVDPRGICVVVDSKQLQRIDKRKDRVEISPDQLSLGIEYVEELNKILKDKRAREAESKSDDEKVTLSSKPMLEIPDDGVRVLGWYHSHPHITCVPSAIDVNTQAQFEQMDPTFVGLIFGVFNEDKKTNMIKMQLVGFQSDPAQLCQYRLINVSVLPYSIDPMTGDPQIGNVAKKLAGLVQLLIDEMCGDDASHKDDDLLTVIHNIAVRQQSACLLVAKFVKPLLETLNNRIQLCQAMKRI